MRSFFVEYSISLQIGPEKFGKYFFDIEILRRKYGSNLIPNRSIEIQIIYIDYFYYPIILTITGQIFCVMLLSHLFW